MRILLKDASINGAKIRLSRSRHFKMFGFFSVKESGKTRDSKLCDFYLLVRSHYISVLNKANASLFCNVLFISLR